MKCSGDIDGRVPVTSTLYSINEMKLSVKTKWHPWFLNQEVTSFIYIYIYIYKYIDFLGFLSLRAKLFVGVTGWWLYTSV